jgi:hypothetical protein
MVVGSTFAFANFSEAARDPGPAGDMAGAAGAFVAALCLLAGFMVSLLTVVVAKLLRRGAPTRLALRVVLSLADGLLIGLVGTGKGNLVVAEIVGAVLIFVVPVLLCWTWQRAAVPGAV